MAKVMCEQCHKNEAVKKCKTDEGIKNLCNRCIVDFLDKILNKYKERSENG